MKKLESQMDIFLKIYNMKLKTLIVIFILSFFYGKTIAQLKNYAISTGLHSSNAIVPMLKNIFNEKELFYSKYIKSNYLLLVEKPIKSKFKNLSYCIGVGYNNEKYVFFEGENLVLKNFNVTIAIEKLVPYQKKENPKVNFFMLFGLGMNSAFRNESFASYYDYPQNKLGLAFQVSLINAQIRLYKKIHCRIGVGYGYKGIFTFGLSYN
jgi:hypothetical protein